MARKTAEIVVKISKYCNLRCAYCYEFNGLGLKAKMPLDKLERLFRNVAGYAVANRFESLQFIWHGGEPLLIRNEYYEEIGRIQADVFGAVVPYKNSVQTNLTVLTDRHIEFIRKKSFFSSIGVSFDVYGDQRVDTRGALRTDAVLDNMQKLIDNGIRFGAISVLARNTLEHALAIYEFYDGLGIPCRFLPFYLSANPDQIDTHALAFDEIIGAMKAIFDAWLASETSTPVDPVDDYISYALSYLSGRPRRKYDKVGDEIVFITDVDGAVWGATEAYDPRYRYGNLFEEDLGAVLRSAGRARALADAAARMRRHCDGCLYFGHCPGIFAGDATPQQAEMLEASGCPVRAILDHIVASLDAIGATDWPDLPDHTAPEPNAALAVPL